jgi:hypothetical protein
MGRLKFETAKYPQFYEESQWMGMRSPPCKYNPKYDVLDKNPRWAKIFKESQWASNNTDRIKAVPKKNEVSPGHYENMEAYKISQCGNFKLEVGINRSFGKDKLKSFIDVHTEGNRYKPAPGYYKYDE